MMSGVQLVDWLARVESEFREMPGMALTEPQMRYLWALDRESCQAIVTALLARGVLRETPRHAYALRRDAP